MFVDCDGCFMEYEEIHELIFCDTCLQIFKCILYALLSYYVFVVTQYIFVKAYKVVVLFSPQCFSWSICTFKEWNGFPGEKTPIYNTVLMGNTGLTCDDSLCDGRTGTNYTEGLGLSCSFNNKDSAHVTHFYAYDATLQTCDNKLAKYYSNNKKY